MIPPLKLAFFFHHRYCHLVTSSEALASQETASDTELLASDTMLSLAAETLVAHTVINPHLSLAQKEAQKNKSSINSWMASPKPLADQVGY